jgi:Kef-type K+ transport system membrane component KefB
MQTESIIFSLFVVFTGAAIFAGLALYARQSLLVAYIFLGVILGPWGFKLVNDTSTIQEIGHIGIIFLLFILGMNLHPAQLFRMFREALIVTLASSIIFALVGGAVAWLFGYGLFETFVIGAVMMFSSTIIGIKLLPTTALHHRHVGQVIISILLLQDILAISILTILEGFSGSGMEWSQIGRLVLSVPTLVLVSFAFERYFLIKLIRRFNKIQEYIFLTAIGWCLGVAQLAVFLGLSYEIGAFIAGVSLATSPISRFIAESFKPLRDFFLIMFFFSLGASFNLDALPGIIIPAGIIAILMLVLKPLVLGKLLSYSGETGHLSAEAGIRLGQLSEFSFLIAILAVNTNAISQNASYLIQTATLITFIASSYLVMFRYPTPIAVSDKLRRD